MANITDPKKKIKIKINGADFTQDTTRQVRQGSAATLSRDEKGNIQARRDKDYAGISPETMRQDYAAKRKAKEGDGTYDGASAPRGGGPVEKTVRASGTGSKKLMIKSIKRVKKSDASPQAKRSAIKVLKMKR
jgi:hypothetical protein